MAEESAEPLRTSRATSRAVEVATSLPYQLSATCTVSSTMSRSSGKKTSSSTLEAPASERKRLVIPLRSDCMTLTSSDRSLPSRNQGMDGT